MEIYEYQHKAMKTAKPLDPTTELWHMVALLTGEAGEVADCVKKHLIYGKELDTKNLKEELGDIAWGLAYGCHIMGWSLENVMQENIEKLAIRHNGGAFTDAAAIAKVDQQ